MKITADDLFDLLPIVDGRGWEGVVIRDKDNRCPLCALANEIDPSIEFLIDAETAFKRLGLGRVASARWPVMNAADWWGDPRRPRLMQALGMKS